MGIKNSVKRISLEVNGKKKMIKRILDPNSTSWRPNHWAPPIANQKDLQIICRRFSSNKFALMLEDSFRNNNYNDYVNGISVLEDRVCTKRIAFVYSDYGLANLDMEGCWQLANWLIYVLPKGVECMLTSVKSEYYSPSKGFYYETSGGHLGYNDSSSYGEKRVGYQVKLPEPVKKEPPKMKW
ncbi:MAG: hypothetical protein IKK37_05730 [Clostridia bacterium]|nr:hypothetical protein [Clostridia bacterium]